MMLHVVNTTRIRTIPAQIDYLEVVEMVFRENHETCALLSAHPDSHAEALSLVTYAELPPHGLVAWDHVLDRPCQQVTVVRKPATKARKGINPFTGEETVFKAKPARNVVKIRPLKNLKDMV